MDLKRLYTDYGKGAFRGEQTFYKFVKAAHPNVTRNEIREFLMKTDSYTLHKPKRKVRNFRRIYSKGIGYQMQMDLVDLQKFKSQNNGFCWTLNIIDCFSRKAWIIPLKNKKGSTVHDKLKTFLLYNRPIKIEVIIFSMGSLRELIERGSLHTSQVDQGGEFYNTKTLTMFHSYGIQYFSVYSDTKNSIIERLVLQRGVGWVKLQEYKSFYSGSIEQSRRICGELSPNMEITGG